MLVNSKVNYILIFFYLVLLIAAASGVEHRTRIDDYLFFIIFSYGVVFNVYFINYRTDCLLGKKFLYSALSFLSLSFFYICSIIFTYIFFRVSRGSYMRWEFYFQLPDSKWQYFIPFMLISIFLGIGFYISHEILFYSKIKKHSIVFLLHVFLSIVLSLFVYLMGIEMLFSGAMINFYERVILILMTFLISLIHIVSVDRICKYEGINDK